MVINYYTLLVLFSIITYTKTDRQTDISREPPEEVEDKSDESTEYIIVKVDKNKFVSKESSESIEDKEEDEFKEFLMKVKDYKNRLPEDLEDIFSESTGQGRRWI